MGVYLEFEIANSLWPNKISFYPKIKKQPPPPPTKRRKRSKYKNINSVQIFCTTWKVFLGFLELQSNWMLRNPIIRSLFVAFCIRIFTKLVSYSFVRFLKEFFNWFIFVADWCLCPQFFLIHLVSALLKKLSLVMFGQKNIYSLLSLLKLVLLVPIENMEGRRCMV